MLLESARGTRFINNTALWLMQHSPFTWEIDVNDFSYASGWDKNAENRIGAVRTWLSDQSFEERESFTEMLYHIATSSGASNIFRPDSSWAVKMSHIIDATKAVDAKSRARIIETLRLLVLLSFKQKIAPVQGTGSAGGLEHWWPGAQILDDPSTQEELPVGLRLRAVP